MFDSKEKVGCDNYDNAPQIFDAHKGPEFAIDSKNSKIVNESIFV